MKTGENGKRLIIRFEGMKLHAYLDQVGIPTIGFGHTGKEVKLGQVITIQQAEDYLMDDLKEAEDTVNNEVFAAINNNQFDALVSFCYNLGGSKLKSSTLLKYLNKGSPLAAANQLSKWVYAGKPPVIDSGLVKRRAAEKVLFLTPMDEYFKI